MHPRSPEIQEESLDPRIHEALVSAPLAAPPPLLYLAVMRRVQQAERPKFRITWLDVALPAFFASMLAVTWLALSLIPEIWIRYFQMQAEWGLQKLLFVEPYLLAWSGIGLALLGVTGIAAVRSLLKTGFTIR